jgi:hypothetical protein
MGKQGMNQPHHGLLYWSEVLVPTSSLACKRRGLSVKPATRLQKNIGIGSGKNLRLLISK